MTGQTTDAQIGAFLIGLSMKGETIEEITASAKVMRSLATPVEISNSDYLVSFGERLSDDLVSFALQDLKKKSTALNGKEVGIVTDSNFGESRPLMDTTRIRISKTLGSLLLKK